MRDILAQSKDALAACQSVATILVAFLGALWAYFKLIKGRVYNRRLEPAIKAKVLKAEHHTCILVSITIKNVGLTRVDLDQSSSTIIVNVYSARDYVSEFHNALWREVGIVQALLHHSWIEPGELVSEERLIALPHDDIIAVGVRLRLLPVRPRYLFWRCRPVWNSLTVTGSAVPLSVSGQQGAAYPATIEGLKMRKAS